MSNEKYDYISEIDNVKNSWKLKVKVISLWKTVYELQMIVMDEKCHKIGAVVKQALCPEYEHELEEGGVYMLSRFGVADNRGKYPVYHQKLKINFYRNTNLVRVDIFDGPSNSFDFLPFTQVYDKKDQPNLFTDVIGRVVDSGDLKPYDKDDGSQGLRINIQLEDSDNVKLNCTFWDDFARNMYDSISSHKSEDDVVLIIQFGKIKYWTVTKEITIQNAYFGTKLWVNADYPEVIEFRQTLASRIGTASSSQAGSHLSSRIHDVRDDFLSLPKMTIDEIVVSTQPITCVLLATITFVERRNGWFYVACRKCKKKVTKKATIVDLDNVDECKEKVDEDNGKLYCSKCEGVPSAVYPSYKVQVRVQDGTGSTSLVMFDREVNKLLRRSAVEVREKQVKEEDSDSFPEFLSNLEQKRILFIINLTKYNIDSLYQVYTVSKVCNDPTVIASFDNNDNGDDGQDDDDDGVDQGNTNTGGSLLKDVASFSGSSNAVEVTSETVVSPLKRPVDDVNDEGLGDNSTSKKKMFNPVKIEK